ncbi:RNA polymerase sigma factor [Rhabdothermincola salaria]|uniref:RNA polymerase sigma factor n=1 Tax=Rhabdothermincola salaria TaxID=2903142 RepID=UPI001E4F73B6|nr:hypothetical protein [Rhabdothermincola salaria]MCD9624207.1 hypothetical protein [Rhabdothermincola salaria]
MKTTSTLRFGSRPTPAERRARAHQRAETASREAFEGDISRLAYRRLALSGVAEHRRDDIVQDLLVQFLRDPERNTARYVTAKRFVAASLAHRVIDDARTDCRRAGLGWGRRADGSVGSMRSSLPLTVGGTDGASERERVEPHQALRAAALAEEEVNRSLDAELVRQALGRLDELDRKAVWLVVAEGRTVAEAAVEFGFRREWLSRRLGPARARLREALVECGYVPAA